MTLVIKKLRESQKESEALIKDLRSKASTAQTEIEHKKKSEYQLKTQLSENSKDMKLLRGDLAKSASEIKTEMENIKILKEKQEKENKLFKKEI